MVLLLLFTTVAGTFAEESYYIQTGAFVHQAKAEHYAAYLNGIGLKALVIEVNGWYKVFLGPYSTEEEARVAEMAYEQSGESGFLVLKSEMFAVNIRPEDVVVNKQEQDAVETTKDEAQEDKLDPTDTEQAEQGDAEGVENAGDSNQAEGSDDEEETQDPVIVEDDTNDQIEDNILDDIETDLNDEMTKQVNEKSDADESQQYKQFTIALITVLWLLFILVVIAYRLKINSKIMK